MEFTKALFVLLILLLGSLVESRFAIPVTPQEMAQSLFPRNPGCNCIRASLHKHLCRNDFVLKVKIMTNGLNSGSVNTLKGYTILIQHVYKLPVGEKLEVGERVPLYTPAGKDFCGTNFKRRTTYLIAGRIMMGYLFAISCDYSRRFNTVTKQIEQTLRQLPSKRHCQCQVTGCSSEQCSSTHESEIFSVFETSSCSTKKDTLIERCHEDYGVCRLNNKGNCAWQDYRKVKSCLNISKRRLRSSNRGKKG